MFQVATAPEFLDFRALSGCAVSGVETGKGLSLLGQLFQQGSRLPEHAVLALKFADAVVHFSESHGVREPHRSATMRWKAIPIDVDNINVHCAKREAFFQDARAFVDQRVDATVHDFLGGNLPLRNSSLGGPLAHEGGDFGIDEYLDVKYVLVAGVE